MKMAQALSHLALGAILILTVEASRAANAVVQQRFAIEEYELFHEVLDPLQHEALSQRDFQSIRSVANELVARGNAIVALGTPAEFPGASESKRREFVKTLRKFERALAIFRTDAHNGSNTSLKKSFHAVRRSFERLADLVPEVYSGGSPPVLTINCPSSETKAGEEISLTADFVDGKFAFSWTLSAGKILMGQGTRMITIDTTDLAGQKVSVSLEARDESGHAVIATCGFQLSSAK